MREIKKVLLTTKYKDENLNKLKEALAPAEIFYHPPIDYNFILKKMSEGASKEEVTKYVQDNKAELKRLVKENDFDVAIFNSDMDDSILQCKSIKWIHCAHAGVEKSANPEIFERGIIMTTSAGRSAPALAEHVFAFILSLAYDMRYLLANQEKKSWDLGRAYQRRSAIFEKTIGIIGLGHTGSEVAKRAKGFDMHVIGFSRELDTPANVDEYYSSGRGETIDELLKRSDYVVLSCSLNDENYHMINKETLSLMKKNACLINLARGGLIDEKALVEALENGVIAGAGLDTVEHEPLVADSPLWTMPNVYITPHTTPAIADKEEKALEYILKNIAAYKDESPMTNVVTKRDMFTKAKKPF
ncbi:MAG: D-2-hydroxyacid dehydrogenase [Gammaproteobacteria bacterium]|nr:D-2-hydroxyacid dehydrogenase [Gammaproteobacteria bacterium]